MLKQLILGHYSTRYENIDFLKKKRKLFFQKCCWLMTEKVLSFKTNINLGLKLIFNTLTINTKNQNHERFK